MKITLYILIILSLSALLWGAVSQLSFLQMAHPAYLWGLWAVIPLMGLLIYAHRKRSKTVDQWFDSFLQKRLGLSLNPLVFGVRGFLLLAMLACILMALARPQGAQTLTESSGQGIDILVALDVSDSTLAMDVSPTRPGQLDFPNRLGATKEFVQDMFGYLGSDRVGIMAFTNEVMSVAPFSHDYQALEMMLNDVSTELLPSAGTSLSAVLYAARGRFDKTEDTGKVLVIFSDGEDHEGNIDGYLEELKKMGVMVFTVGVGTTQGAKIPYRDNLTLGRIYKQYEGQDIITKLQPDVLKDIAKKSGGAYFHISEFNRFISALQRAKSTLKTRTYTDKSVLTYEEKFQAYLVLALFLLLLERILFLWENKWQGMLEKTLSGVSAVLKKKSFATVLKQMIHKPSTKAGVGALVAVGSSVLLQGAWYWPFGSYFANQDGKSAFKDQSFEKSAKAFEKGLKEDKDNPVLHYNRGNALYRNQDYGEALSSYQNALKQPELTPQQRADILYNMGNAQYRQGQTTPEDMQSQWESALDTYEEALKQSPTDTQIQANRDFVKEQLQRLQRQQNPQSQQNKDGSQNKSGKSQQNQQNQQNNPNKSNQGSQNQQQNQSPAQKKQNKYSDQEVQRRLDELKEKEAQNQKNFRRFKAKKGQKSLHDLDTEDLLNTPLDELADKLNGYGQSGKKNW